MDPHDSGPIYKETLGDYSPVIEPWNTFSNILFLAIVVYWGIKVYQNAQQQRFLLFNLPILLVGFVGGAMYHGTRAHNIWLLMDWVPIVILSFSVAIFFSIKNRFPYYGIAALLLIPFGLSGFTWNSASVPSHLKGAIGYSLTAFTILFPIFFYLYQTKWQHVKWVFLALLSFSMAITFRSIDNTDLDILPMGTHWLWHVFGALASNFLLVYIYLINSVYHE